MKRIEFANGAVFDCPERAKAPIQSYPSDGKKWIMISVLATAQEVADVFVDNARYCYVVERDGGVEKADMSRFSHAGDIVDTRDGIVTVFMREPTLQEVAQRELENFLEGPVPFADAKLVDLEDFVQEWHEGNWEIGTPVCYKGQVYRVIQWHDSTGNPTWNPEDARSLWGLCHSTNPLKAKPWVEPLGTSGMYKQGECYKDEDGIVWRQVFAGDNVYDAKAMPDRWERA